MPDSRKIDAYLSEVSQDPSTLSHGRVLYIIHELSRLISTTFDQAMARHKLTHGQWWAIMHIYENQGVSQSDLANVMQMGRASAGKLLERMEAKGWIERRPDPADSRVRRVYLADGVLPVMSVIGAEAEELYQAMLGNLDPEFENRLLAGLRQIRSNAQAELAKPGS